MVMGVFLFGRHEKFEHVREEQRLDPGKVFLARLSH